MAERTMTGSNGLDFFHALENLDSADARHDDIDNKQRRDIPCRDSGHRLIAGLQTLHGVTA